MLEVLFARFLAITTDQRSRDTEPASASSSRRRRRSERRSGVSRSKSSRQVKSARAQSRKPASVRNRLSKGQSQTKAKRGNLRSKSFSLGASSRPSLFKLKSDSKDLFTPPLDKLKASSDVAAAASASASDSAASAAKETPSNSDAAAAPPQQSSVGTSSESEEKVGVGASEDVASSSDLATSPPPTLASASASASVANDIERSDSRVAKAHSNGVQKIAVVRNGVDAAAKSTAQHHDATSRKYDGISKLASRESCSKEETKEGHESSAHTADKARAETSEVAKQDDTEKSSRKPLEPANKLNSPKNDIRKKWVKINVRSEKDRPKSRSSATPSPTLLDRSSSIHTEKKVPPKSEPPAKKKKSDKKKTKRRSLLPFFDFGTTSSDSEADPDRETDAAQPPPSSSEIIVGARIPSKNASMDQTMMFSVESPRRNEPQSLTLEQYPRFIDLNCEFLSLHRRLDVITQRKYPLKRALQSEDLDPAARVRTLHALIDRSYFSSSVVCLFGIPSASQKFTYFAGSICLYTYFCIGTPAFGCQNVAKVFSQARVKVWRLGPCYKDAKGAYGPVFCSMYISSSHALCQPSESVKL